MEGGVSEEEVNSRSLDAEAGKEGDLAREVRDTARPSPRHPARLPYLPSHPASSGFTPTSYNGTPNPSLTERGLKRHRPLPACGHVTHRPRVT